MQVRCENFSLSHHILEMIRDVPDFTFSNPAGADLAGFENSCPTRAGTEARFENLVQHKTTPVLE